VKIYTEILPSGAHEDRSAGVCDRIGDTGCFVEIIQEFLEFLNVYNFSEPIFTGRGCFGLYFGQFFEGEKIILMDGIAPG
jgi:hypothetical protein